MRAPASRIAVTANERLERRVCLPCSPAPLLLCSYATTSHTLQLCHVSNGRQQGVIISAGLRHLVIVRGIDFSHPHRCVPGEAARLRRGGGSFDTRFVTGGG